MEKMDRFLMQVIGFLLGFFLLSGNSTAQAVRSSDETVAFSQNLSEISVRRDSNPSITLDLKEVPISKALKQIADQAKAGLYYNSAFLPDITITLHLQEIPLDEALQKVLAGTSLQVITSGRNITLQRKKKLARHFSPVKGTLQETVTGTVKDGQTGKTMPGVNIRVKGTTSGTSTDTDGHYRLNVESLQDSLIFSFVGYQTRTVAINGRTTINIVLQIQALQGQEMVVVGYGTQKKENLTSSISTVSSDELNQGANASVGDLIRGKVPGLTISQVGSNPASQPTFQLRGVGSFKGDTSPLVIVDGIEGSLSDVAPEDIQSVSVLKGASASAIYGTRGSNGVVLIKTKASRKGHPTLEVRSYVTAQQLTQKIPLLNADEYRQLVKQGVQGATDYKGNTNWVDETMRNIPISSVNNMTLSAGDDQTSYIANLNYKRLEGIFNRSDNNVLNGRFQINHSMFDGKLNITVNAQELKGWRYDGADYSRVLKDVYQYNPTRPIKNDDGTYNENADNNSENPVALIKETDGKRQEQNAKLFGHIEYSPIKHLSLKAQGSTMTTDVLSQYSETPANPFDVQSGRNGYASQSTSKTSTTITNLTATYKNSFKSNHYTLLAGYTWKQDVYQNFGGNNYDFPTSAIGSSNLGVGTALTEGKSGLNSYKNQSNLIGYFARLNYDYKQKYLLTASFRREASSKFGANHKWGLFPAVSAGWNISQEAFMNKVDFVSNLKVRFGFGITGTQPTDPYQSLSLLNFGNKFLYQGQYIPTAQPLSNPNPDLEWEHKKEYSLGLDFGLFQSRLTGSMDIYQRETSKLLYNFTVPTPPFFYNNILANAGSLQNTGIEIHLKGIPIQSKNVQWNSTVNYSTNKNKLQSISNQTYSLGRTYFNAGSSGGPINRSIYRVAVGKPIGNYYGFKSVGVTKDGHWLIQGKDGKNISITDATPSDMQIIGNGSPDFRLSWSNDVHYKNWDLSVLMEGAFGFQILNNRSLYINVPTQIRGGNVLKGTFDSKFYGKKLSVSQSKEYVSYFLEDGDYWKIDNLTLGYSFGVTNISALQKARIYFSVDNLYTITGYSGFDPASINYAGLTPGFDPELRYPSTRKFTLGVSFTF